jgi:hypothetical protein
MCHFLAPVGSVTTIGDAPVFEVAQRCGTTPFLKRGVNNAVLHYTSIQNRCTDHRLVRWQQKSVIDRSHTAEAI